MKYLLIFLSLFFIIIATTTALADQIKPQTCTLVIHIAGFENSTGIAKVAVVNSKENYEANTPFKGFNCDIINKKVIKTITLPYGEYAVKVYHDENANNELDTRMFGIPKERYGFSNDARGSFGPPEYNEAAFNLNSSKKEITIILQ